MRLQRVVGAKSGLHKKHLKLTLREARLAALTGGGLGIFITLFYSGRQGWLIILVEYSIYMIYDIVIIIIIIFI